MSALTPSRRQTGEFRPTVRGWETEDGFLLVMRHGSFSKRPLGFIWLPWGGLHMIAGGKRGTLSELLSDAEREIRQLRASRQMEVGT